MEVRRARSAPIARAYPRRLFEKGVGEVRVSPGWIAAPKANGVALRIAEEGGNGYDKAVQMIMNSLSGLWLGQSAKPEEV
jgi:hypothetical protein